MKTRHRLWNRKDSYQCITADSLLRRVCKRSTRTCETLQEGNSPAIGLDTAVVLTRPFVPQMVAEAGWVYVIAIVRGWDCQIAIGKPASWFRIA